MRLEWIDDILAVLDTGSLARAAERRLLTQSAFTRRVRMIEESVGATLFDRRRKPVTLLPGVEALEPELRDLSVRLRRLQNTLRSSAAEARGPLTFVCQHAISTTLAPRVVSELALIGETSVRIRSGNRDDCLMRLLCGEADFAIMYEVPGGRAVPLPRAFEAEMLGSDRLIPVCTPSVRPQVRGPDVPIVGYPPGVFMGVLFDRMIAPRLPDGLTPIARAESALTLAILQLCLNDIGVAWLPETLMVDHLSSGRLVRVDDALPSQALDIRLLRLSEEQTDRSLRVWRHVIDTMAPPVVLKGLEQCPAGLVQPVQRTEE